MQVNKVLALKIWKDCYGNVEWARDSFGTYMHRDAYSNEAIYKVSPRDNKRYDYSWNIDHIRPKSDFTNESDADFTNNYQPMHRENNIEGGKGADYPDFHIKGIHYKVVKCSVCSAHQKKGYGIVDDDGNRVDCKGKKNYCYV